MTVLDVPIKNPGGVAVGAGAVWVTDTGNDMVSQIDPTRGSVVRTITVGKGPVGVVAGSATEGGVDQIWVANTGDTTISMIDPRTGNVTTTEITAEVRSGIGLLLPSVSGGITLGEGAVWIRATEGSMVRLDPATGEQTMFVAHTLSDRALAAGEGGFWSGADSLQRFDLKRSNVPVDEVHLPNASAAVAVGGGSVWVCTKLGYLVRIDPLTNQADPPIPIGHQPNGIAVGLGSVWVTSADDVILQAFLRAPGVAGTIPMGGTITGIAVGEGSVWVTVDEP
jgi:YVTN family beta-propeller protein